MEWISDNILYSTGKSIQYSAVTHGDIYIHTHTHTHTHMHTYTHLTDSLCCTTERNTTLKVNYTAIKF